MPNFSLLLKKFRVPFTIGKTACLVMFGMLSVMGLKAQVSGAVFRDFNGNGTKDANEPLVSGVTVNAYLANSTTPCGTTTTTGNTSPNYSLTGCGTAAVRVEFLIPSTGTCANSNFDFSALNGTTYGSSIQFVNGNSTNVNFALHDPNDYNTGTTGVNVFVPCYVSGDPLPANSKSGSEAWFVGYPYTTSGGSSTKPPQMIGGSTLGATWGVAYSKQAKKIFTSAFLKRHVGLGTLGSGGIYMLTPTPTSFTVNSFYDLDANGHRTRASATAPVYGKGTSYAITSNSIVTYLGSTDTLTGKPSGLGVIGTNAERGLSTDPLIPTFDPAAFDQIGKVGLGDIDISDDGKYLFVMNLYSKKVFRLELNNADNPTSVVNVTSYDIPATTCTNGEYRPFGLKFSKNKVYVGVVCSGENGGTVANLNAAVYELTNPTASATFNPTAVISLPLNFNRTGDWRPWVNDSDQSSGNFITFPTPLLSDIEFSDRGDMILSFMDRSGHQWGFRNRKFLESQTTSMEYNTGGDVLIAGLNCSTGAFTLENNGSVTTTNGVTLVGSSTVVNQAPGGKEFFDDDSDIGDPSEESVFGAAAVLKGLGEVLLPAYAISLETSDAGTMKLSTTNGSFVPSSGFVLYSNNGAAFGNSGKANGLGDVELSTPTAPIEIGNRIWKDTDKDGIQDASEEGIDGVVIELYEGTSATGSPTQTVTSATNGGQKGTWYFTKLKANQDYVIKVKTALGTGTLAACNAFSLTGAGTILIDNNTNNGTIALKTGSAGENNHSFDIGVNEGCVKPSAGTDQTIVCTNNALPTSFDLVDAASGQKWKIISPVPAGASISVITPSGAVSGTILAGVYKFRLQTQSDSVNCADTVQVTIQACPCLKPNAGPDQTLTCVNGNPPTGFNLVDAAVGQKWKIISPVPAGASISVTTPTGTVSGTIVAGVYKFRLQTQSDSVNCADTIQVTVPNCTPGSDPICFSSSRVVTDNKLGAVCNPPVTPDLFYSFYMIFKNTSGTFDRFKTTDLKFEEYCDGTAKIYGTVCSVTNPDLCLDIVYNMTGRTTTPPAGSPYAGFCNAPTGIYYYYMGGTGTVTGKSGSGFNNFSATIVRDGAAFQVGVGANTNENVFGASGWIKPTIVNDGDGNWTIEVEPTSGVAHGDFNVNLSNPTPLYNLTATGSTVCQGQTATLSANLEEKCTVTYTWTGPNGFTATGANVNVPNAVAGTYTVKAEITSVSGAKCNDTATAEITVNPKPTVTVVNGYPVCRANGTTYTIKFTKSTSGAVVTAKNIATGAAITVTGDSVANVPLTVAKVRLIVTSGVCRDSIEVSAPTCDKPLGSIGDFIWKDINDNGLQDLPAEKGVAGIKVNLYAAAGGTKTGAILQTKTTATDGLYLFSGLLAGDYIVEIDKTTLPDTCQITSKQNIPSDDSKDSDFNPTSGLSQVVILNPVFNPTTPTEILATNNLTIDAGLVVPCVKSKVTLTGAPVCSADVQTYSITFSITGKNGIIKVNKGTLTGSNPYSVTGIPSGATIKITDSLSAVCKFDTLITGPNCNCNPSLPKLITSSFTTCIGDTFPTLKATVVGLATVEWFATTTGTTVLHTGLNFKPSGTITGNTYFYAQARSTDPACPVAISTGRVMATISAQDCTKEVDLALKKSINTKIAQIGDVLTYTLKVWNESGTNATGVEVADSIATTVQFQTGSFTASRGTATINGNVIKWVIGGIAAAGDTVTLTYQVKATQEGVHFNTAEICKTNEKDIDSTPCNNDDEEDDIDRQCFTVPIKLCPGEKAEVSIPAKYTNVQWFKNSGSTPIGSGNVLLLSEVGTYTFTATNQTCPVSGCCPIIIEPGINCCPEELCIPFTIIQTKKGKK